MCERKVITSDKVVRLKAEDSCMSYSWHIWGLKRSIIYQRITYRIITANQINLRHLYTSISTISVALLMPEHHFLN